MEGWGRVDHDLHLDGPVISLVPLRTDHAERLAALRCDAVNSRSAGAIQRLGARPEGGLLARTEPVA